MPTLSNKTAIVTGAGQGIGRAIALKLAGEGARVVANDLDEERLESLVKEIEAAGGKCITLTGDVTAPDFGDTIVDLAVDRFGGLDIVINNAGYIWNSRIANHTDEQWYAMMDVHATAPFRVLRAAAKYFRSMAKSENETPPYCRKVVNISSISGLAGEATQLSYSAAKSALVGMTRSLAKDWGRYNVTVNCVAFGFIDTRLTQIFEDKIPEIEIDGRKHTVGLPKANFGMMQAMIPLGRAGTVEEAAGAVYLFCLPESDYISGEIVVAGGGYRG